MATKIVTKNSSTASAVPTASDLVQGELAVNVADKKLFTEDNSGAIIELADGVKLAGIEASADVTDTANVTAAGALMDSELTSEASVKALNQGVATTDSPAFAGLTVDTDTLAVDSTNNRVGIGTSSPDTLLNIASESAPTFRIENTDTSLSAGQVVGALEFFSSDPSGKGPNVTGYIETRAADSLGAGGEMVFATGATGSSPEGERAIERMRIDSSGNVGIGTSSPSAKLNIDHSGFNAGSTTSSSALKVQGSYGGGITISDTAESGFYSDTSGTKLYMYVGKTGSDTPSSKLVFAANSSGNLAIGTTAPQARLHLSRATDGSEASPHFRIDGAASTYTASHWLDSTAYYIGQNSTFRSLRIYSGAETSGVHLASGGTSWGTFSDERLKYDVEPVENALESLSNLRTVKYRLKDVDSAEDKKKIGLMAQDLVGVLDEVIDPVKKTGDDTEYMSVKYTELVPVLIKAIQEQQNLIESLTSRIAALEE